MLVLIRLKLKFSLQILKYILSEITSIIGQGRNQLLIRGGNLFSFFSRFPHFSSNFFHFLPQFGLLGWAACPPGKALATPLILGESRLAQRIFSCFAPMTL